MEEGYAPLAEYTKTTISSDHIEENSALTEVVNPLEGVSNDQVTHADMKLLVDAVVKPNPLRPHQQLKDLKTPANLRKFMKKFMEAFHKLVDDKADMGTSNAFQITQVGSKKVAGVDIYFYSIGVSSQEGKDNLLAYKWKPEDLIFKYYIDFREPKLSAVTEPPSVLYRVALAQTRHNQHNPPPLSQYVHCLLEAGLEA